MPKIVIDGRECEFKPGQMILQVATANGIEIPQYCYHDALSIVASCRICLAEVWTPNPRNNNALEPIPKLVPTCQTACTEGMVVYSDSPKSIANQKAVMEYLLINHPLDCPVCDQSGECFLQDYSYEYGRGQSRFEEAKVKNPKKDLGPHVYLYADRCIMCTRCVRFTREVTGTAELLVEGRGNKEEIDVFPGLALDNDLSANVIDLCPVGALLDKDFLFAQRVWFLKGTPSIDGITASGDNIRVDHNDGKVYRIKPRTNMAVNKWWISDEVRYGWKFVHSEDPPRIATPRRRQHGIQIDSDWNRAYLDAVEGIRRGTDLGSARSVSGNGAGKSTDHAKPGSVARGGLGLMVSPMLSCEDAYLLARLALGIDPRAVLAVGPIPVSGQDKTYPPNDANGYKVYAEKCPNSRGVRRVLEALSPNRTPVLTYQQFTQQAKNLTSAIITGNYPSDWITDDLLKALDGKIIVAVDTLDNALVRKANVVLPGCTWVEKAGTFENARGLLQAFEQAIPPVGLSKSEGQIALDLMAVLRGDVRPIGVEEVVYDPAQAGQVPGATEVAAPLGEPFNAAHVRRDMAAAAPPLSAFSTSVSLPAPEVQHQPDMEMVEL